MRRLLFSSDVAMVEQRLSDSDGLCDNAPIGASYCSLEAWAHFWN